MLEPQPLPVDQYLAERARYGEARSRGQQKIDQLVVGGAAGALTLSVTFLHDIAPHPLATSKCWLLLGWGSLGVALVLSFASHWTSANAFSDCIKHLDDDYAKTCYTKMPTSVWTTATVWFNRGGMLLLALGLIALARFAYVNIPFTESPHLAANGAAPSISGRENPAPSSAPSSAATSPNAGSHVAGSGAGPGPPGLWRSPRSPATSSSRDSGQKSGVASRRPRVPCQCRAPDDK